MAAIPGTVINSSIVPNDTNATYATHQAQYGKGGWRTVQTLTDLNAIPNNRRENGMVVWVAATSATFQLVGGITNSNWQPLNIGVISGGSSNVYTPSNSADWYTQPSSVTDGLNILASKTYAGMYLCETDRYIYTINHAIVNPDFISINVSVQTPALSSTIYSVTTTEHTSSSFKVVLSGIPESGYKINWNIVKF